MKISDLPVSSGTASGDLLHQPPAGPTARLPVSYLQRAFQVDVRDYGVVGDGTTDDTDAYRSAVAAVNTAGGGKFIIPPGLTIRIGKHHTASNGVNDIEFVNCSKGVHVVGHGSKIDIDGAFDRAASSTYPIRVMSFRNCQRVHVEGLEIDGNVDQATNSVGATEPPSHLVMVLGCVGVTLDSVYLHHGWADGLYVGSDATQTPRFMSKDVSVRAVRCSNNARQGFSVCGVRGLIVQGSTFEKTGVTEGSYPGHAPMAGVDVEPNEDTTTAIPSDVNTGNITFTACVMRGNLGSQYTSYPAAGAIDNVTLSECRMEVGASTYTYPVILNSSATTVDSCHIDVFSVAAPTIAVYPTWETGAGIRTVIRNSRIEGNQRTLLAADATSQELLVVERCVLRCKATTALTGYHPQIQSTANVHFNDNTVFIPSAAYSGGGTGHAASIVDGVECHRNRWTTDLVPTTNEHFFVSWASTVNATQQWFPTNNAFRPGSSATWDTSQPYGAGLFGAQMIVLNRGANISGRVTSGSAAPTSGTWKRGDVVFATGATATGAIAAWICIVAGTPGTWRALSYAMPTTRPSLPAAGVVTADNLRQALIDLGLAT